MDLKKIYSKRNEWCHKGDCGYLLVIAGSKKYTGSPIFNALAALRAGADLVCCLGPQRAMDVAASFLPDLITFPLPGDTLRKKHLHFVLRVLEKFDALVLGSGLGRSPDTFSAIKEIVKSSSLPMVIDADGIQALSEAKEILKGKKVVLTPHLKEFEIFIGEKLEDSFEKRAEKVKQWAKKLEIVILLKGHFDIISDGEKIEINKTGSPYMTKGGFGDTLAGILGALLARKIDLFEAAKAAAFINGKAGELASQVYGEGVLASDIFEFIPKVIEKFK